MARHLKASSFKTIDEGARTLPEDTYIGFCLGPSSEHDRIDVEVPGTGTVSLSPGVVVPIPPTRCAPVCSAKRFQATAVAPAVPPVSVGHVIGLTCREELAVQGRRASYQYPRTAGALTAGAGTVELPFAGRRRLAMLFKNTEGAASVTVTIKGRRYYAAGSYDEYTLKAAETVTAGSFYAPVVGGTNEAEAYDTIAVVIAGAGTEGYTLSAEAFD